MGTGTWGCSPCSLGSPTGRTQHPVPSACPCHKHRGSCRLCLHSLNKRLVFEAPNAHKNKNLSQVTPASVSLPLTICLETENKFEHKEHHIP